ncbi:MAG: sulfotransferase family 2 domain-containing protein [Pseudomonadota bacterium]
MGLVDRAKTLRSRAVDKLLPQRFVFHHVPKCGGTSVGRALRKRYILSQATVTPESSFRAFETFTGRSDREQMLIDVLGLREQMMLYHLYEDVRGVSLHVGFSEAAHAEFSDRYKFVTILRDPVARFVSHYNWSFNKPKAHGRIEEDFDTFLGTERAKRVGATFVEYYCGRPSQMDICSSAAVERAIANLAHFSVIGDLANLQGFERGIAKELGVKVKIRHENKNTADRKVVSLAGLSESVRAKVEALCAPDLAVWQAAQDKIAK